MSLRFEEHPLEGMGVAYSSRGGWNGMHLLEPFPCKEGRKYTNKVHL